MTEGFGNWFKHLREDVGRITQQALAMKCDVSDSTISRIENGEGAVQLSTLNRLGQGFEQQPAPQIIAAVAKSFAEDNDEGNKYRSERLMELAAEHGWRSNELVVGISLEGSELITTTAGLSGYVSDLTFRSGWPLYDQLSQWGGDASIRLAARYRGVVLMRQEGYGDKAADYFEAAARTVRRNIERQVDPLAGVSELDEAMRRARSLMAGAFVENGDAVWEALGWVILLANAVGAQLDVSPYMAWLMEYRGQADVWRQSFDALGQAVPKAPTDPEKVLSLARPWLEKWSGVNPEKPSGVSFTRGDDGTIAWRAEPDWVMEELVAAPGNDELWLYGGQTEQPSQVLASCGIEHLALEDEGPRLSNPQGTSQVWFRNPANADYAIVNVDSVWVPVQLF
ncbi:helix-turn-helix transcriptional regulator [Mycobacteroides abscessus]|uniref:helix-turn-helix transcriptional regulator n=1 Tax=Mycobacteroides abscessus TaxID=36809 RepID=UPI0013FD0C16|nr:helix-turn-helix transcriptional regulator [Mycobacteroides abscessus]